MLSPTDYTAYNFDAFALRLTQRQLLLVDFINLLSSSTQLFISLTSCHHKDKKSDKNIKQ